MECMLDKNEIVHQIRKWPPIERLNLISDIWNEKKLLLNRLANYRTDPESAIDWDTLSNIKKNIEKI